MWNYLRFLTEFCVRMAECGRDQRFREKIVRRAVEKHTSNKRRMEGGSKQMYRSKNEREIQKEEVVDGKGSKTNWFKSLGYRQHRETKHDTRPIADKQKS